MRIVSPPLQDASAVSRVVFAIADPSTEAASFFELPPQLASEIIAIVATASERIDLREVRDI
jgi:hypothetical protein